MRTPFVTQEAFANLAGAALADDVVKLSSVPEYTGLVLFSDLSGGQLAILPIGPQETYVRFEELDGITLEGMRPLCALRLERRREPVFKAAPSRAASDDLARLAESLRERELYLADCERKMAEVGQGLAEREAMLEQREHALEEKERDFFRRSGDSVVRPANGIRQA